MTATRRAAQPPRDDVAVAAELAVMREILTRLEAKIDTMEVTLNGHAQQIDRWRTAGKVVAPLLMAVGALAAKMLPPDLFMWLGKAVRP